MCNLQEHSDRSAREHAAQRQEPIYTELAAEYGIEYQPPCQTLVQKFGPALANYQPHGHMSTYRPIADVEESTENEES